MEQLERADWATRDSAGAAAGVADMIHLISFETETKQNGSPIVPSTPGHDTSIRTCVVEVVYG